MTIDFTKYRKNTLTRGNRYIAVCPKCNQKGERVVHPAKDGKQVIMFIHTAVQQDFATKVLNSCTVINEVLS